MTEGTTETTLEEIAKRRVPCLAAFLHPFRIVDGPESPKWHVSLDQVNSQTWDYAALHEIVGGIEVGLEAPYHLVVCRDGCLALPPIPDLRDERRAVEYFNRCLAAFLIGGIYCEAINLDGLDFGSIIDWKYVRVTGRAEAAPNRFHNLIRLQGASSIEAIALEEPRKLELAELIKASDTGHKVLECIPSVGSEYLLRGATGYARRDWGVALANFWIVVEQITSHLWGHIVIQGAKNDQPVTGRIDNLEDNRTWTISVRHEVLFQRGALPLAAFEELNSARKARNKLSHSGVHPDEGAARAALNSVRELFKTVFPDIDIPFLKLNLDDHGLSDPFRPKDTGPINPKYWMEIKKLPGERELEKLEANARTEGKNTSSF